MKCHPTVIGMAINKKEKIARVVKYVEKLEPLNTVGGNVKECSCYGYGKQNEDSSKVKKQTTMWWSNNFTLGNYQKDLEEIFALILTAALFAITNI